MSGRRCMYCARTASDAAVARHHGVCGRCRAARRETERELAELREKEWPEGKTQGLCLEERRQDARMRRHKRALKAPWRSEPGWEDSPPWGSAEMTPFL